MSEPNPHIMLTRIGDHIGLAAGRALTIVDDAYREALLQGYEDAQDIIGWAQGLFITEHAQGMLLFWDQDEPGFDKYPQGVLPYLF